MQFDARVCTTLQGAGDRVELHAAATTLAASEPRRELETASASAHDHHAVQ
jgi:hypothetical protein